MLVVTRKVGEVICVGDYIEVMIVQIKGNQVRVGIKAKENLTVLRKELKDEKAQTSRDTSKSGKRSIQG